MVTGPALKRVALIEDDEALVDLIKTILEDEGYEVVVPPSQHPELQRMSDRKIDLVVLDLHPGFSGRLAFVDSLASSAATRDTPVLGLSAFPSLCETFLTRPNVIGVIGMPFGVEELLARIKEAFPSSERVRSNSHSDST